MGYPQSDKILHDFMLSLFSPEERAKIERAREETQRQLDDDSRRFNRRIALTIAVIVAVFILAAVTG
jgi:hypothetical protein